MAQLTRMNKMLNRSSTQDLTLLLAPWRLGAEGFTSLVESVSQSVSYFTVPPRAHTSTGSQSGSATPGLTQVPSTRSRGLLAIVASEVNLSQRTGYLVEYSATQVFTRANP